MANKEKMRHYSAWAVSVLCILSFLVIIFGIDYRVDIIIHILNLIIAIINFNKLYTSIIRYEDRDLLEYRIKSFSDLKKLSQSWIDLMTLSMKDNFTNYIIVTYIIHTMYSFLLNDYFSINIFFVIIFFVIYGISNYIHKQK